MILVLDNVLQEHEIDIIKNQSSNFNSEVNGLYQWNELRIFYSLIRRASNYYSLHNCVGYEVWEQKNSRPPTWHQDKDEILAKQNILKFPICTLVYYIQVENLINGKLQIETGIDVTPITNRLVIFGPGVSHYVEEFSGYRHSIVINPWDNFLGYK